MKQLVLAATTAAAMMAGGQAFALTDTIDASSGQPGTYFVPNLGQEKDFPYYRGIGEGWGWTHNPLAGGFLTAELNISAFDVDEPSEVDEIFALDNGVPTLLGTLVGEDDEFSFTTFALGANFFDDIEAGLEVYMEIDTDDDGWLVSLAKSTITLDGAAPPDPNPGAAVPLPAAGWALLAGLGALGVAGRRRRSN